MKIKCPDGAVRTVEECKACGKCYPKPIMDLLLKGRDKRKKKEGKPRFGVGRLISCLRKAYFDLTEEVPMSIEKLWIFSRGHAIHDYVQKDLPKEDVELFLEKEFGKFNVIGFADAVHDGTLYELKTSATIPDKPKENHIMQAQAYHSMLPEEKQKEIKDIIIIYFSLHKIKYFTIPKRNVLSYLEARGTMLAEALKHGIPPNKEISWLCDYCEYKQFCDGKVQTTFSGNEGSTEEKTANEPKDEPKNSQTQNLSWYI